MKVFLVILYMTASEHVTVMTEGPMSKSQCEQRIETAQRNNFIQKYARSIWMSCARLEALGKDA